MKKRILSILLCLCMVLMLVPTTAFAEGDDTSELQNMLRNGGEVTLEKDYTIVTPVFVSKNVTLDLNGHTINITGSGSVIQVELNSNLTLQDSSEGKTGVITGGNATYGGGVIVVDGSFTMTGGTIKDCSATSLGGGVAICNGSFTMTGGTIKDCSATSLGGGVFIDNGCSMTMSGGAIANCSATTSDLAEGGGGVFINRSGSMTMSGGTIEACSADTAIGGGVASLGNFSISNGTIQRCSAKYGGGVSINSRGNMTMTGGTIEACTSTNGTQDAVRIEFNASLLANGGTIKDTVTASSNSAIKNTSDDGCTVFYDAVTNYGTIEGGVYYGGIVNDGGTITESYHTVSFDPNGGIGSIPTQWFVNIDTVPALEPATEPTREEYSFEGWYNGDTKYEFTESVTDNITLTARWKDIEKPVITGLEHNKTYCDTVEFEVSDNDGVASVTANGVSLTPDANNKYTLEKGKGTVTVVAKDNADNETTVTVTVNNGHTFGAWQSNGDGTHTRNCTINGCKGFEDGDCTGEATCTSKAVCEYCDEEYGEKNSNNHTGGTEIRDAKDATCTEEGYTGDTYCIGCGEKISAGTAIKMSAHNLENIPAKDATVTATGNKEYWHCKDCKKYFSNAAGTNEIKLDDTIISKLSPEIIEGKGQSITAGEKKELTFKSNAAFSDFIRVELDGKTLDEKNYTVKEGSTVVTLKADYVATLSADEHTIGIVSESGTATTTFTVNAKTVVDNDTKSPQTGDNSHMALWTALLFVSGAGVIGTTVYGKKKRAK